MKIDVKDGKRERFAVLYARTGNATEAAKQAGYSPRSAPQTGCDLLKREDVQEVVRREQDALLLEVRAKFLPASLNALDRLQEIVERGDIKSMATVQAASAILKFAGFEPDKRKDTPEEESRPLGIVVIPQKCDSIEEWVALREERERRRKEKELEV